MLYNEYLVDPFAQVADGKILFHVYLFQKF